MRFPRKPLAGCALGALLAFGPAGSARAQRTWAADVSREQASVTTAGVDGLWKGLHLGVAMRDAWGGCAAAVDHLTRSAGSDVTGSLSCFRRLDAWTVAGGVAAAPGAVFLSRFAAEGHVSRRLAGTVVASLGYRFLAYRATEVHQAQPALTWYHPRGEVEARAFLTYHAARDRASPTALLRTVHDVSARLRVGAGASYGDRIFDVGTLPDGDQRAWQVYGWVRAGVTRHDFLSFGAAVAHERPAFDLTSWTVGYSRSF